MQEVVEAVDQDSVESRIKKQDFDETQGGTGGGVAIKTGFEIMINGREGSFHKVKKTT